MMSNIRFVECADNQRQLICNDCLDKMNTRFEEWGQFTLALMEILVDARNQITASEYLNFLDYAKSVMAIAVENVEG